MKSVRPLLLAWLLSAWLPSAYGQVMALNSTGCLPDPNSTIENDLYSRFGISGAELHRLGAELAGGRRASAATLLKYKLGDNAARYALVAQASYTMRPSVDWDGSKPPEWRLDSNSYREFADSGLAISVYRRINQGQFTQDHTEAVIAIRGTEVSAIKWDGGDVWADTQAAFGYPDRQTKQAIEFVSQWLIDNNGKRTAVVGHSLGGRLAQIIASKTGLDAYTFNAAAVRKEVAAQYGLTAYAFIPAPKNARITSVVSSGDWVNPWSKVFILAEDLGERLKFDFCGPDQGHGIDGVVTSLGRVQKVYRELLNPSPTKPPPVSSGGGTAPPPPTPSVPPAAPVTPPQPGVPQPPAPAPPVSNPASLSVSEGGRAVAALLGDSTGATRNSILGSLLAANRVASDLTVADVNAIIAGMEDQRRRTINQLARRIVPNLSAADIVNLSGQTAGADRNAILASLLAADRVAEGLSVDDVNLIIAGMEEQRRRTINQLARRIVPNLSATDVVSLSGPTKSAERNAILASLLAADCVAEGLSVDDVNLIIVGMEDQRARTISQLSGYMAR